MGILRCSNEDLLAAVQNECVQSGTLSTVPTEPAKIAPRGPVLELTLLQKPHIPPASNDDLNASCAAGPSVDTHVHMAVSCPRSALCPKHLPTARIQNS